MVYLLCACVVGLAFRECQSEEIGKWAVLADKVDVSFTDFIGGHIHILIFFNIHEWIPGIKDGRAVGLSCKMQS